MKEKTKNLDELIPEEFTEEHKKILLRLIKEDRRKYNIIKALTDDNFDNPEWCKRHGFSYKDHRWGDYYRVMIAHAYKEGYIKEK